MTGLGSTHFIGIGGAGMSGLARILLARGEFVSGSDVKDSRELEALRVLGARVFLGQAAEQVPDQVSVVVSQAIRASNVEVVEAHARGLPVLHRAEALAALMEGSRGVAVAGTHGKTTTTSMLTVALQRCGADPSFAIGGHLSDSGANAHQGSGDVFVAEADESDGSFLHYRPEVAIVTNVDPDHLDHYGTEAAYRTAFDEFAACVVPGGHLVTCADDPGAMGMAQRLRGLGRDVRTYGEAPDADLRLLRMSLDGRLSPLRRPALRLRAGPLSGLPARDVRRLLLPPTLLMSQLPSETHAARGGDDRPHDLPGRSPPAAGLHHSQTAPPVLPL